MVVDAIDPGGEADRHAVDVEGGVFDVVLGEVDRPARGRPAGLCVGEDHEPPAGQFRLHRHGRRGPRAVAKPHEDIEDA